jgi:low affinity Fe/Cu permease
MEQRQPTWYTRFTKTSSRIAGRPLTFVLMTLLVAAWAISGPYFGYSDTWQLTINTGTTIITFLMVFVIQATQNRDAEAIQIKLDEIIRALEGAHNAMLDLEELEEDDLIRMRDNYLRIAHEAREALRKGRGDTGVPDIDDAKDATRDVRGGERKAR